MFPGDAQYPLFRRLHLVKTLFQEGLNQYEGSVGSQHYGERLKGRGEEGDRVEIYPVFGRPGYSFPGQPESVAGNFEYEIGDGSRSLVEEQKAHISPAAVRVRGTQWISVVDTGRFGGINRRIIIPGQTEITLSGIGEQWLRVQIAFAVPAAFDIAEGNPKRIIGGGEEVAECGSSIAKYDGIDDLGIGEGGCVNTTRPDFSVVVGDSGTQNFHCRGGVHGDRAADFRAVAINQTSFNMSLAAELKIYSPAIDIRPVAGNFIIDNLRALPKTVNPPAAVIGAIAGDEIADDEGIRAFAADPAASAGASTPF